MQDQNQQPFLEYTVLGPSRYSGLAIISVSCAAFSITLFLVIMLLAADVIPAVATHYVMNEFGYLAFAMIVMGATASLICGIGALAWTSRKLKQPLRGRWMAVVGVIYGAIFGAMVGVILLIAIVCSFLR
ncbi:MAG: hypothetical protein FWD53_05165 [Phycisphaerales bacterium]|nr:hypothetical protein [Phycisphaerales bacterium]